MTRAGRSRTGLSRALLLVLGAVVVAGCVSGPGATASDRPATPSGAELAMAGTARIAGTTSGAQQGASLANAFAFDLYRRITPDANTVFSPASISLALAMARPGARGETATEMDRVMHGLGSDANANALASLGLAMDSVSGHWRDPMGNEQTVTLRIANAAYGQRDYQFVQSYLDAIASRFGAGVRLVDYRRDPEAARQAINAWVDGQTEQRIPELLAPGLVDDTWRLALVNAIYLKAPWFMPFTTAEDAPFTRADGSTVNVPMMRTMQNLVYGSGKGWKAVQVPYYGDRLVMTVIVPDDLAAFDGTLDAAGFDAIVGSLAPTEVELSFPKFKTETKVGLGDMLQAMGMHLAFDRNRADFSGITSEERLYIAAVIHQANITVDEKGTEAAAATVVAMAAAGLPAEPIHLDVNRPFLYAIRDRQSGAILFLGRVLDPRK